MMDPVEIRLSDLEAALIDLDGVVTDTAVLHMAAWTELFRDVLERWAPNQEPFDPTVDYLRYLDGRPRRDGIATFLASRGIDLPGGSPTDSSAETTLFGLAARKNELFLELVHGEGVRVFSDAVVLIQRLRVAGISIAVVSSSRNCRDVMAAAGVAGLFDVVVDGRTLADHQLSGKPHPAPLLFAARRLGSTPQHTAVIEDSVAGVEAASAGAFHPIVAVVRSGDDQLLRSAGAHLIVRDLGEVGLVGAAASLEVTWTMVRDEMQLPESSGRTTDALLTLGDGVVGVRGDIEVGTPGRGWLTLASGAYGSGADGENFVRLLPGPSLTALITPTERDQTMTARRSLDLRRGTVVCRWESRGRDVEATRFVSQTTPGLVVVRAVASDGAAALEWSASPFEPPRLGEAARLAARFSYSAGELGDGYWWAQTSSDRARIWALARQACGAGTAGAWLERVALFTLNPDGAMCDQARRDLAELVDEGLDSVLERHQRGWSQRWSTADIEIVGDELSQSAIRFALFHLLSCAPSAGEVGVAARGLTGLAYAGHVFWDADVFVLPALAAIAPDQARAIIEYRLRRVAVARDAATALGHGGVRFPWESADSGDDVTPRFVRDHEGEIVDILSGPHEEHINSDVPWALLHYVDWTGDTDLLSGGGGDLVTGTAAYWASRIRTRDGSAHIDGVVGPDEYHGVVDDDAFTNIMARWHLRKAATLVESTDASRASQWRELATKLTDGFDPVTGRHEQFDGFSRLEPLLITEVADVPVAADVLLGRRRVAQAQVVKQPAVLMAHHLVPDELPAGSLQADLDFYLPRTAHGSSLSPAICAALLARVGRPDEALGMFDIAARLDLDDLTGTTGSGLHLATLGGLWQAVVYGFGGVRPAGDRLCVDPCLPRRWKRITLRLQFRGVKVRLQLSHDRVIVDSDEPIVVEVHGIRAIGAATFEKEAHGWRHV